MLHTGDEPGWLHPTLSAVLPMSAVVIAVPLLGAVVRPRGLISWYEDRPANRRNKKEKKGKRDRDND